MERYPVSSSLNQIIPRLRNSKFDLDPHDDDDQKPPSSFREMMAQINVVKNKLNPYRYSSSKSNPAFLPYIYIYL